MQLLYHCKLFILSILLLTLTACGGVPLIDKPEVPAEITTDISEEEYDDDDFIISSNETETNWLLEDQSEKITQTLEPPPPVGNLWKDLSEGYQLLPKKLNKKVLHRINRYRRYKNHFNKISKQAQPYLYYIVQEIKRRHMPMELALLPAIESAFKTTAYSSQHAAGLWQVIPSTGRFLGLKQNRWYDGRRDVIASTNAALDYLESLHKNLNNDWLHAIAAYNCGEGALRRAIRKNKRRGKSIDFWSLDLPKQTRDYIPKLMAYSAIFANPDAYGVNLPDINNIPYLETVDVGRQISLSVATKLAGISKEEFKRLNAGYKKWATAPNGPHILLLPKHAVSRFKQNLAKLSTAGHLPHEHRRLFAPARKNYKKSNKNTRYHVVRKGDTLWKLANRYHTTVKKITYLNALSRRKRLKLGQRLKVISVKIRQKPIKTNKKPNKFHKSNKYYMVRKGDTLFSIAKHLGISIKKLRQENHLNRHSVLSLKQKLIIPKIKLARKNKKKSRTHKVKSGDTLWKIAKKYQVNVTKLAKWNRIKTKSRLHLGQKLIIWKKTR